MLAGLGLGLRALGGFGASGFLKCLAFILRAYDLDNDARNCGYLVSHCLLGFLCVFLRVRGCERTAERMAWSGVGSRGVAWRTQGKER